MDRSEFNSASLGLVRNFGQRWWGDIGGLIWEHVVKKLQVTPDEWTSVVSHMVQIETDKWPITGRFSEVLKAVRGVGSGPGLGSMTQEQRLRQLERHREIQTEQGRAHELEALFASLSQQQRAPYLSAAQKHIEEMPEVARPKGDMLARELERSAAQEFGRAQGNASP